MTQVHTPFAMRRRDRERGVVLVNVLAMLGMAGAIVALMLSTQERGIETSQAYADTARAQDLARGGVTSAVVALRRDLEAAPEIDHASEPWGRVADRNVRIDGGQFSLSIRDAQDRFNINLLAEGTTTARQTFGRITRRAGVPDPIAAAIARGLTVSGPIDDLSQLALAGEDVVNDLRPFVTTLPGRTDVNINAVGEPLLAILLQNPARAGVLIAQRDRQGFLTPEDVRRARVLLPAGVGYTSSNFVVEVEVTSGSARQRLTADITRTEKAGVKRVDTTRLIWNAATPDRAPPR